MPETVLQKTETQTTGPAAKVLRGTFAVADAIEDSIEVARRVGKHSSDAAEEWMDDTIQRIKRHPTETVVMAFAAGFMAGGCVNWMVRRK